MLKLTENGLKESSEFKDWITGKVALIHNIYHDSTFIIVSDENDYEHEDIKWQDVSRSEFQEMNSRIEGSWTITRFFLLGDKIQVSVDHSDVKTEDIFKILLSQYSRGLE